MNYATVQPSDIVAGAIEKKKARLLSIKTGLKFKKVKPKRIYCHDDDDNSNDEKQVDINTAVSTHSSHTQSHVMSLAEFSSVHSGMSLECAANLGLYCTEHTPLKSVEDRFSKSNSSTLTAKKEHICGICNQECDEHQYVCLSYNQKCKHMFHAKCMIRFLMKEDHCPICGEWYLNSKQER